MKNIVKQSLIALVVLVSFSSFSQNKELKRVKGAYNDFAYVKTSEILLEVAEKGFKSQELFQKLGNSFYFNNQMEDAAKWYGELINYWEIIEPEYYFRYAMSLRSIENYEESDKWMKKFYEMKPDDSRGKAFLAKIDYVEDIAEKMDDIIKY